MPQDEKQIVKLVRGIRKPSFSIDDFSEEMTRQGVSDVSTINSMFKYCLNNKLISRFGYIPQKGQTYVSNVT